MPTVLITTIPRSPRSGAAKRASMTLRRRSVARGKRRTTSPGPAHTVPHGDARSKTAGLLRAVGLVVLLSVLVSCSNDDADIADTTARGAAGDLGPQRPRLQRRDGCVISGRVQYHDLRACFPVTSDGVTYPAVVAGLNGDAHWCDRSSAPHRQPCDGGAPSAVAVTTSASPTSTAARPSVFRRQEKSQRSTRQSSSRSTPRTGAPLHPLLDPRPARYTSTAPGRLEPTIDRRLRTLAMTSTTIRGRSSGVTWTLLSRTRVRPFAPHTMVCRTPSRRPRVVTTRLTWASADRRGRYLDDSPQHPTRIAPGQRLLREWCWILTLTEHLVDGHLGRGGAGGNRTPVRQPVDEPATTIPG